MYDDFAGVYDLLMDDVDYAAWADYYAKLMEIYGKRPRRVAECACGTGSLTVPLARMGYEMTGLDLSAGMLRAAGEKARRAGVRAQFVRQDMRALTLGRRADAVLATCDGVNYLTDLEGVRAFFRAAFLSLCPGGGLFFDISSRYKLSQVLGDAFYGEERESVCYLWQNRWQEARQTVEMDLTFFVREADGRYRRFHELHRQRAHAREEIEGLLLEAGFEDVRAYGDKTFDPPAQRAQRIHFAAKKPAGPDASI
ncbi:methyltransferase domain-containing protein [Beduinella massiliensis]|uniref:methyltransferase domain-containing protein n=1 Tax=Beduinella massiliensis TaxID=1852363 RepID=UPI000C854503